MHRQLRRRPGDVPIGDSEWVVEIDRPARPPRRDDAKSDALDATHAAREALGREHLALPRSRGDPGKPSEP